MLTWQSGMDGNRDAGCVAVFVSEKTSYNNELQRDKDSNLERIVMSGRGGREKGSKGFVHVRNQEHHKNYPMFVSVEHRLPIRLILEDASGKITYQGLWRCTGYTYLPHQNCGGFNVYQFTLMPCKY